MTGVQTCALPISLTGMSIGTFLLLCGFAFGVVQLARRTDLYSLVLVGAYLSLCFFVLPTRVHERYVFPTLAFICLLTAADRTWLWATLAVSVGSFINLHAVLSQIGTENVTRLPLGHAFRSPVAIVISITLQVGALLYCIWSLQSAKGRLPFQSGFGLRNSSIAKTSVKDYQQIT